MLRQSKSVRASYVRDVIDRAGDEELLAQIWMLRQSDAVRASYLREVLEPRLGRPGPPPDLAPKL
jgi:hypothetical protein